MLDPVICADLREESVPEISLEALVALRTLLGKVLPKTVGLIVEEQLTLINDEMLRCEAGLLAASLGYVRH
jgi:hypothetical protein